MIIVYKITSFLQRVLLREDPKILEQEDEVRSDRHDYNGTLKSDVSP